MAQHRLNHSVTLYYHLTAGRSSDTACAQIDGTIKKVNVK